MIFTKEHQEAMVRNYAKKGKSNDEVLGYIHGLSDAIDFIIKKEIEIRQ